MKTRLQTTCAAFAALLAVLACSEPTQPLATSRVRGDVTAVGNSSYTITDLGTLGGGSARANAINDTGQVVGRSATATGRLHAFLWTATDGMKDLGTLGGSFSQALAVNARGHVAGVSALPSGERRPFFWTPSSGMQDLGTFGGGFGTATGMNDRDQVVGYSTLPDGSTHAFRWDAARGLTDLVALVGDNSAAYGINNQQQVVGGNTFSTAANNFCGFTIPFLWSRQDGFRNLGELGSQDPCGGAFAEAVSENGVAVGIAENDAFVSHPFRWTEATGLVDLGTPFGPSGFGDAHGVNARGQIVGTSFSADGSTQHAFVWDERSGMRDLGTFPGDAASVANGINASGWIAGTSSSGAHDRAVLWTPRD